MTTATGGSITDLDITTEQTSASSARSMAPLTDEPGKLLVQAVVWVERTGQKAIVIGKGGERLKEIGRQARLELKEHFAQPVHLELWVKVKEDWSDSEAALRSFGYDT